MLNSRKTLTFSDVEKRANRKSGLQTKVLNHVRKMELQKNLDKRTGLRQMRSAAKEALQEVQQETDARNKRINLFNRRFKQQKEKSHAMHAHPIQNP